MKRIKEILIAIPLAVMMILISFVFSPLSWFKKRKTNKEYKDYLLTLEGKNFFCYNNRKKGFDYIQESIIPNLPSEVELIYLNGKNIENEKYETKHLSKALHSFKNYNRFPQLLKIRNGETADCSLNTELFKAINNVDKEVLLYKKIYGFFELKMQ